MSVFQNALMFTALTYGILYDIRFIWIFLSFLGFNLFMYLVIPGRGCNSTRRKIMSATWEEPKEGCIYIKNEVDCTKVNELLKNYKGTAHPTLTHFGIKAMAQVLNVSRASLNCKIVFGKFIPFDTVDVTCLVDIDGGKDLAALTIRKCDEMNIINIAEFINSKATVVKKNAGDEDHKKRTGSAQFFPPFILTIMLQFTKFISYYFGINTPSLGLKRNNFGGACITSIGSLGIKDAYVPHCNFMNVPVFVALGKAVDRPIVRDGQVVIAPVMYVTFTLDHRFLDGGKSKAITQAFFDVFDNPQKYFDTTQEKYQGPIKDVVLTDKSKVEEKKSSKTEEKKSTKKD